MCGSLAKEVKEKVFDLDKVGVGDIVEFPRTYLNVFGGLETTQNAGLVLLAEKDRLLVETHIPELSGGSAKDIESYNVYVKDADKVKLIYRSYHNASRIGVDMSGRR